MVDQIKAENARIEDYCRQIMEFKKQSVFYNKEVIRILQTYKVIIKLQEEKMLEVDWENLERMKETVRAKNEHLGEWIKKMEGTYMKLDTHFKRYVGFKP